ncbi:MAG TPA: hypothetical protein VEF76_03810 [Patescibacteria group bacterium]|nr:hypothetical protein [Patescibacteria group bacterium]
MPLLLLCLLPLVAQAGDQQAKMSLAEAYRATNVAQHSFDPALATMPDAEKRYLSALLAETDKAVIERMQSQAALQAHAPVINNYGFISMRIGALDPPMKLYRVHQLVRDAVLMEQQYFDLLRNGARFDPQSDMVQSIHRNLLTAYSDLLRLYPNEPPAIRQSFYAHLCALDFI